MNRLKPAFRLIGWLLVIPFVALPLTWVSNHSSSFDGWQGFLVLTLVGASLLGLLWLALQSERPPRWLWRLTWFAILLHLIVAVFWVVALPLWGHNTPPERAGYVFGDAYARDTQAWRLARTQQPLVSAFFDHRKADQYGGMLFLSAAIYRYLAAAKHQPLLTTLLAAFVSALAVPLTWAFARRLWGESEAKLAAWGLTLYPEVVLLGSSQMREAFIIPLVIASFYGLIRFREERDAAALGWTFFPPLLCAVFSPLMASITVIALVFLAAFTLARSTDSIRASAKLWLGVAGLSLIVLLALYLALQQFAPPHIKNPIEMVRWWFIKSTNLQLYFSQHASGWLQKIFRAYPPWVKLPLITAYGLMQPFLPASLVAVSHAPLWQGIAVWRAIGWTGLLILTVYAALLSLRTRSSQPVPLWLSIIIWSVMLISAIRAGGDMWDNPRYRAAFSGLQIALAAWAWVEHRRQNDPILRRTFIAIASLVAWFIPWYLRRYFHLPWPMVDFFKTLGAGGVTLSLLLLWDWAREQKPLTQSLNNSSKHRTGEIR